MSSAKRVWTIVLVAGLMMVFATPAFARSISLKDAGGMLWVFIAIGLVIVLLQLIPAAILFFSFIGTTTAVLFKGNKKEEGAVEMTPGLEPAPTKK